MSIQARWFFSLRRGLFFLAVAMLLASFFMTAATGLKLYDAPRNTALLGWQCMTQTVRSLLHPIGWELLVKHPPTVLIFLVLLAHPVLLYVPRLDQRTRSLLWPVGLALLGIAAINLLVIAPHVVRKAEIGFYVWTGAFVVAGVGFFVPPTVGLALGKRQIDDAPR